jgi:hypothetical protein
LGRFGNLPPEGFKGALTPADFNADFDLNYHPVGFQFPLSTPSNCLVLRGDSFASISEQMYGDSSFAGLIADENGYHEDDEPPVGMLLKIPSLVNTNIHNWEG